MSGLEHSGFAEFDRMAVVFRRTLQLLDLVTTTGSLPDGATRVIANESLPHVEDIEQGFRVSLRASAGERAEWRALVSRAVIPGEPSSAAEQRAALIETMNELARGSASGPEILPAPVRYLAALEHARLVFALLPGTAAHDVHSRMANPADQLFEIGQDFQEQRQS